MVKSYTLNKLYGHNSLSTEPHVTFWQAKFISNNVLHLLCVTISVTSKKSPNVYTSCPKMILPQKWMILPPLQKLPNNVSNLGKIIVATGFECLPKKQKIAQSGHTGYHQLKTCARISVRCSPSIRTQLLARSSCTWDYLKATTPLWMKLSSVTRCLIFKKNIWASTTMKTCPIASHFCQGRINILPNTKLTLKILPK